MKRRKGCQGQGKNEIKLTCPCANRVHWAPLTKLNEKKNSKLGKNVFVFVIKDYENKDSNFSNQDTTKRPFYICFSSDFE